jgi:hypothetical protein
VAGALRTLSCLVLSSTCNWGCKCSALERAAVRLLSVPMGLLPAPPASLGTSPPRPRRPLRLVLQLGDWVHRPRSQPASTHPTPSRWSSSLVLSVKAPPPWSRREIATQFSMHTQQPTAATALSRSPLLPLRLACLCCRSRLSSSATTPRRGPSRLVPPAPPPLVRPNTPTCRGAQRTEAALQLLAWLPPGGGGGWGVEAARQD